MNEMVESIDAISLHIGYDRRHHILDEPVVVKCKY